MSSIIWYIDSVDTPPLHIDFLGTDWYKLVVVIKPIWYVYIPKTVWVVLEMDQYLEMCSGGVSTESMYHIMLLT